MTARATFSVTAMMREAREVVLRFINFYRAAGAEHIYIYYDAPLDELVELDLAGVTLTECSDAFWADVCGSRPGTLDGCLEQTHLWSARRHASDWLLVVDADEFVTGGGIAETLARVPGEVEALRVRNVEAVWGPGDDPLRPFGCSYFRKPLSRELAFMLTPLLYGRMRPFFTYGLAGHSQGKQFLRRGAHVTEIRSHYALDGTRRLGRWAHDVVPDADLVVAHFDAISFDRWREKWRRRYSRELPSDKMGPRRAAQLPRIQKAVSSGRGAALRLFRQFYGLSRRQYALLRLFGAVERRDLFGNRFERKATRPDAVRRAQ